MEPLWVHNRGIHRDKTKRCGQRERRRGLGIVDGFETSGWDCVLSRTSGYWAGCMLVLVDIWSGEVKRDNVRSRE